MNGDGINQLVDGVMRGVVRMLGVVMAKAKAPARKTTEYSFTTHIGMVCEEKHLNVKTPEAIAGICADMAQAAQEMMVVLDFNAKNNVVDRRLITLGLVDASLVHPREVFRGAILNNASAVVLVHNHPSGDATPSAEDIRITRQCIEAGRILGICVQDHVIIGRSDCPFLSLREQGLADFTA